MNAADGSGATSMTGGTANNDEPCWGGMASLTGATPTPTVTSTATATPVSPTPTPTITPSPTPTPVAVVSTIAGSAGQTGSTDGNGTVARFNYPEGITIDSSGNLFVADTCNNTIREITPSGVISTIAGAAGQTGSNDGIGSTAGFYDPYGIVADGNLYIADTSNNTIREINSTGIVTTIAGSAGQPGSIDGVGPAAGFYAPVGITADSFGNLYVADHDNNTIRKITPAGVVTTIAGLAGLNGSSDGIGSAAEFRRPLRYNYRW